MDLADPAAPVPDDPAPATTPTTPATTPDRPDARAPRGRLTWLVGAVASVVLAVDQATKALAERGLVEGERTDLVGGLLGLQLLYNPGAAFSMGSGYTVVFTVIMVVVVVVVARSARRLGSLGWAWALGLLLGGAAGNLVDRLVREPGPGRGEVVDFIAYADWFIGNVADIAIVAAAATLVLLSLRGVPLEGGRSA